MTADPVQLAEQADRAAASGDPAAARILLERLVLSSPDFTVWMKLAAMRRAVGDLPAALEAVHAALALTPLDFMALLSKATILERLGDSSAGEAYGRALAQKPDDRLSPQIEQMIAHAQKCDEAYRANCNAALERLVAPVTVNAAPDEKRRISRFRTNATRTTRPFHSEPTRYHFPGLVEAEFHERRHFPWLDALEAATDVIAAEFEAVANAERAELVPYIQYAAHEPLQQWRSLNHSRDWTAIHLLQNGKRIDANARHCSQTMALIDQIPQPRVPGCSPNAMFSLLAPQKVIPPHAGVANTRLVCHLPLIVPSGCWFRVGAETRLWERGKAFVFDDTIEHEAANPSEELRVILIVDVWHPGLSEVEREAVRVVLGADAKDAVLSL